jgi:hypothetical protein
MSGVVEMKVKTRKIFIAREFSRFWKDEPSEWVKIRSEEGFSFIVPRKAAQVSGTLKNMLSFESA